MANEDPNAPPASETSKKKSGSWDWLWPIFLAAIVIKSFGPAGGLVTLCSYYLLKPKLGTWGAVAASGAIGVIVAIGLIAIFRS